MATRAARGISERFDWMTLQPIFTGLFTLFLAVIGFRGLHWLLTRDGNLVNALPLPLRDGFPREWAVGAAVGWGLALVVVLPAMLSGNLSVRLVLERSTVPALFIGVATLLVVTLVEEVVVRGYLLPRLKGVIGTTLATLALSTIYGISVVPSDILNSEHGPVLGCTLLGILFAMAYLRTHAVWLPWGLHFAYRAVIGIVFGLPVLGDSQYSSIVDGYATGPYWLTGGTFGLDAAFLTRIAFLAAMIVLYIATRDYAWNYTHPPIVAAGYEVNVPPPAAHVAMERETTAVSPPPLVQILPAPPPPSPVPGIHPE
jgi:membrane protease YdiL (CAAX protease family)